ncbi:MAG: P-loop NTPase [Candidatus Hydrogenedentota bacterium]
MSKILELLQRIEAPTRNIFDMPKPSVVETPAVAMEADAEVEEELDESLPFDTHLIPIASGKGGVGKTNVSVNLSIALADRLVARDPSAKVILVDCDFGLPNADILLGARITRNIDDFVTKRVTTLGDALSPTAYPGLSFLSGAATPSMTLSNLQYQQRQKFLRHLKTLKAKYLVLDLGASVHFEVIDFFSMVNSGVVVTNPEPTAMRDSYLFIRATLYRKIRQEAREMPLVIDLMDRLESGQLDIPSVPGVLSQVQKTGSLVDYKSLKSILDEFRPKLIVNRSETFDEGLEVARKMRDEARRELGVDISFLGPVIHDPCVVRAVKESAPFLRRYPECDASHWIRNIAERIESNNDFQIEKNYFSFGAYFKRLFGGTARMAMGEA